LKVGCPRRSRNWTSFSSPWARARDGHEVVDLAVGRLALHHAEQNPDEVVAALDDNTEAVIREFEAQHKEARRSLRGAKRYPEAREIFNHRRRRGQQQLAVARVEASTATRR
jgi:hypothetical protein